MLDPDLLTPTPRRADGELTEVPVSLFETPLKALGMSGGTAAFFSVKYKDGEEAKDDYCGQEIDSKEYWIGKDLARAADEVFFYEEALKRMGKDDWEVLNWMTPYKGVVRAPTDLGDGEEREILLLRNARDSYGTCRLLDIKIGEITAVAGWQGKGHFMAWTQKWLDGLTNSSGQGFRLEGFDAPPANLQSMLEHANINQHPGLSEAKLHRFLLQRQPAAEFLNFFLDLHETSQSSYGGSPPEDSVVPPIDIGIAERCSCVEMEELVLLNVIEELAALAAACRNTPVAQQWIGSSVMLAFDSQLRPLRSALQSKGAEKMPSGAAAAIANARVQIFDWGRSEVPTTLILCYAGMHGLTVQ